MMLGKKVFGLTNTAIVDEKSAILLNVVMCVSLS